MASEDDDEIKSLLENENQDIEKHTDQVIDSIKSKLNDEFSYDTLYFDTSAVEYVKYFYFIRAEGLDGNHSEPSDTVSYTISSGPSAISPINTVSD